MEASQPPLVELVAVVLYCIIQHKISKMGQIINEATSDFSAQKPPTV